MGEILRTLNAPLVLVTLILVSYGSLVVWSVTYDSNDYSFNRQLMFVGVSIVLMLLLWRVNYSKLSPLAYLFFGICVVLILMPRIPGIGIEIGGAHRWVIIFGLQLQPSELAKLFYILFATALISRYKGRLDSGVEYFKCFILLMVPFFCILFQPDLGTGMVLFVICMVTLFAGGANRRWLIITVAALVVLFILALILDTALGGDVIIRQYQMERLIVFINPDHDPTGAGYNLKQAQIAIGSGGFSGKGLGNATQSTLGFLPEAPTDFIFCVLAEQFGFIGSMALILIYTILMFLVLRVAFASYDFFGTLLVTAILAMWIFQIFENIGMTLGIMPATGIPLPFVSFGSSSMFLNFMALGLVLSVWAYKNPGKSNVFQTGWKVQ